MIHRIGFICCLLITPSQPPRWINISSAVLWKLWDEINTRIFQEKAKTAKYILESAIFNAFSWCKNIQDIKKSQLFVPYRKLETSFVFPLKGTFCIPFNISFNQLNCSLKKKNEKKKIETSIGKISLVFRN